MREELDDVAVALAEVPELAELLSNPEADPSVKGDVLDRIVGGADEILRNFLRLVVEKGRASELRTIAAEFDLLVDAQEDVLDVELTTAHQLSEDEFGQILGRIEKASGRKVQATRSVDPDLIGGIVLQAGSMRLDASVRGRLERLRQELATT